MANTGKVIVITLIDNDTPQHTKNNVAGDADYIAPYVNTSVCPITYTTTCPVVVATGAASTIYYEFSLPNSVVNNPSIKKIQVNVVKSGGGTTTQTFNLPNSTPNYFSGVFPGLTTGTYTLSVLYLDSSSHLVKSCSSVATVVVS